MADYSKLSDSTLDLIVGGVKRIVDTRSGQNAVLRSGPGLNFPQIDSLENGSTVLTTGESVTNFTDGKTWYEIHKPVHGWISGSLIGY